MSENAEPLNGGKPETPDPLGLRLHKAREAFHPAFASTVVVPGPDGMRVQFDPLDVLVQSALDRVAVQVLLDMLVESGDIDRRTFYENLATSIEGHVERLARKAGPRLLVPR